MARRKFQRKKPKRNWRKKKNALNRPSKVLVKTVTTGNGMPIPDRYLTKVKFSSHYITPSATTILIQKNFRGAGAYDPDIAAGGNSPYGFSSLAGLYGSYICHGSRIRVRFLSTGSGSNLATAGRVVIVPQSTSSPTAFSNAELAASQPYAKDTIVGPAGASSHATITSYMSYKRIFGLQGSIENNPDAYALTSSYPGTDWAWCVIAESADSTSLISNIIMYVDIEYYVEFFDRKELSA